MADLGISFVSLHTIGTEVKVGDLVVLDVEDTPIMRQWYIVSLNKRHLSGAADNFKAFIFEQGRNILHQQFDGMLNEKIPTTAQH